MVLIRVNLLDRGEMSNFKGWGGGGGGGVGGGGPYPKALK